MYVWLHFLRPENWEIIVKNRDRKFEVKLVSILCNIVHKQGRAEAIWNRENVILAPNFFALNHSPILFSANRWERCFYENEKHWVSRWHNLGGSIVNWPFYVVFISRGISLWMYWRDIDYIGRVGIHYICTLG